MTTNTTRGERFVSRLGIVPIGREGHDIKAACPFCDSSDGFRVHQDDCVCQCYVCNAAMDRFRLAEKLIGKNEAIDLLIDLGFMEPRRIGHHHNGNGKAPDLLERVARAKGVTPESFKALGATIAERKGRPVVRFPVHNEHGDAHSHFDLSEDGKGLFASGEGNSGLFWTAPPGPALRYVLVEGPKDAAAAHALGYLPVGMPTNQLAAKYAPLFRGCHVVIVPDRDTAGLEGAQATAARLFGTAASVKIGNLPLEFKKSKGLDLRDALKLKDGEALVRRCIDEAEEWTPPVDDDADETKLPSIATAEGRTELTNGRRFVRDHGKDFRWVGNWKKWVWWNGRNWELDTTCRAQAYAKSVADRLWRELTILAPTKSKDDVSAMLSFCKASAGVKGVNAMLEHARSEPGIAINSQELDRTDGDNAYRFNCLNGTLDLRTGQLGPHERRHLLMKMAGTIYEADAACPRFDEFIHEVFAGNDALMAYCQKAVGYSLTARTSERCLFFLHGRGRNGKSTLVSTVSAAMGDYASPVSAEMLLDKKNAAHPTEVCDLFGLRMAVANETEENRKFAEAQLKLLTGGTDKLKGRRMHEDYWTFDPSHKLWICGNHKPRVTGTDDGIWDRIKLIPFSVRFEQPDPDLPQRLLEELPGIMAWAARGAALWFRDGLEEPQEVKAATADYRSEMDALGRFIDERCVIGSWAKVKFSSLYAEYTRWAAEAGEYASSQTRIGTALVERGFTKHKAGTIWYHGIALNELKDGGDEDADA